jgi:AcrR family transcriptional regulator
MGINERREKEKRVMRQTILETAMKLFLEEGFEKVTIRGIAEQIEYSPATIYLYFKNKNEIVFALRDEGFEKFYKFQQTSLTVKDPLDRLRKHARAYVSFALENPEYYELMFMMRGPSKAGKTKAEEAIGMRSFDFLKKNIGDCMKAGYLKKADLDVAAFAFWSFTHGISSLIMRERTGMFPERRLDDVIEGALDFIMRTISGK